MALPPSRTTTVLGLAFAGGKHQALIDDITRFLATLNFDGLFDVDLIEDKNGTMYFVELNLRYGASGYAVTECGANLPGMFADYMLLGKPIDMNCSVKEFHKPFISDKIMIEEYVNGFITKEEMKKHFDSVDIHFVYDAVDTKSYRHFKKFYPAASLMRKAFQWKNRNAAN